MDSIKVLLKSPVTVNEVVYTELTIGKFRAKHFQYLPEEALALEYDDPKAMDKKQMLKLAIGMMPLIAAMANVPKEVVEELEMPDLMGVIDKVGPFLAASLSQETGSK